MSGGEIGVSRRTFLVGDEGRVFRGGIWVGGRWYRRFGLGFCDGSGGSGSGGFGIGGESCYEAGLGLFEWEDVFLVAFESNVVGNKNVKFQWGSLWYGDMRRFLEIAFVFE